MSDRIRIPDEVAEELRSLSEELKVPQSVVLILLWRKFSGELRVVLTPSTGSTTQNCHHPDVLLEYQSGDSQPSSPKQAQGLNWGALKTKD